MNARAKLIHRIASLVGSNLVNVLDPRDGWPGLVEVSLRTGPQRIAMHSGIIGSSHRNRDDVERRFQNPVGKAVQDPPGFVPLLVGLWDGGPRPVLVAMEAQHRIGKTTRQSLFVPLWVLEEAARSGWAEHQNATGELVRGFHPALLPTFLESVQAGAHLPSEQITAVLDASGLNDPVPETPEERARRASTQLVRNASFSRKVLAAYDELCALCGLNFGLVEGAHVYPARAPGSPDETWNGLALCGNHHTAFDKHLLWIHPDTRAVTIHPDLHARARTNPGCQVFLDSTFTRVQEPRTPEDRPRRVMLEQRYAFFAERYAWAS